MSTSLSGYRSALSTVVFSRRLGWVRALRGMAIESAGPDAAVGDLCEIQPRLQQGRETRAPLLAEVVGLRNGHLILMPYGHVEGVAAGCEVTVRGAQTKMPVGSELLGRVIDAFGGPLDGLGHIACNTSRGLKSSPINPMQRPRITEILETGVRAIDGFLTLGQGQRVGIFAGSGVGKSTLLGMIAKHLKDPAASGHQRVNVIALIGERGREVREFIEKQLGPEGMRSSVVVAATADQPPLTRVRAAYAALAIAEHFRDEGKQVVLTMDSITRFAMARREIGLAASEPPTARGYTPSVFAELPEICERCGTAPSGGSITALLTVLVEGDDMNEPIADSLRSILDGHIVLSRQIAHRGIYPAIDVLKSASRLMPDLTTTDERRLTTEAVRTMALLEQTRQMVELGAYESGSSNDLDQALLLEPALRTWLTQEDIGISRAAAMQSLRTAMHSARTGTSR